MAGDLKRFANQMFRALGAPWRLVRWEMKKRAQLRDTQRIFKEYLERPGVKKLHLGCGNNLMPDWLNTDIYTTQGPNVAFVDGTVRFPFEDTTFDYAFSEHMIEHIPYAKGAFMLKECFRVLRPGGKVRIATPNLAKILALYTDQLSDIQQQYIRWSIDRHNKDVKIYTPAHVINTFMTSWGHRFVYDVASLKRAMEDAGFVNVTEHPPEKSDDPNLAGIELHAQEIGSTEMNELETMVLEGTKPAAGGVVTSAPARTQAA